MRDTSKVQWQVPEEEWTRFRDHVHSQFGTVEGYLGREAELAMKQYIDADGYAGVEDLVNRLVEAAGRTPEEREQKNKSRSWSGETTRTSIRVGADLKAEFKAAVDDRDNINNYGQALARALNMYRTGGRSGRLEDKLDRIVDDAESLLSEINDESDDKMGAVQRKTIAICNQLGDSFKDEDLNDFIHEIAASGEKASEPTLEKYRDLVLDRLDYERHPNVDDLWVSRQTAEKAAPDGMPAECRRTVERLDEGEMKRRLIYSVGRRAMATTSRDVTLPAAELREEVFDDAVSQPTMHEIMDAAADHFGIGTATPDRQKVIRVNLNELEIDHPDMAETIEQYAAVENESMLADSGETTLGSYGNRQGTTAMADGGTADDD